MSMSEESTVFGLRLELQIACKKVQTDEQVQVKTPLVSSTEVQKSASRT